MQRQPLADSATQMYCLLHISYVTAVKRENVAEEQGKEPLDIGKSEQQPSGRLVRSPDNPFVW